MNKIILASQSPRRKWLMELAEIPFEVVVPDVDETNPPGMAGEQVPEFLACKKADAVIRRGVGGTVVAADTVVLLDDEILGKPTDTADAEAMLGKLSGKMHTVVTGVCLADETKQHSFSVKTRVYFRPLSTAQIRHYVEKYRPLDKAGAYAIQEWIGLVGIEKIDGDYYNVMGLPIGDVITMLDQFHKK